MQLSKTKLTLCPLRLEEAVVQLLVGDWIQMKRNETAVINRKMQANPKTMEKEPPPQILQALQGRTGNIINVSQNRPPFY